MVTLSWTSSGDTRVMGAIDYCTISTFFFYRIFLYLLNVTYKSLHTTTSHHIRLSIHSHYEILLYLDVRKIMVKSTVQVCPNSVSFPSHVGDGWLAVLSIPRGVALCFAGPQHDLLSMLVETLTISNIIFPFGLYILCDTLPSILLFPTICTFIPFFNFYTVLLFGYIFNLFDVPLWLLHKFLTYTFFSYSWQIYDFQAIKSIFTSTVGTLQHGYYCLLRLNNQFPRILNILRSMVVLISKNSTFPLVRGGPTKPI